MIQKLHWKNAPTGDPTCPLHILEAKDIHCLIGVRADVCNDNEGYNFVTNQISSFSNEDNQLEYEVYKVELNNNDNNDVEVLADKVVPQYLVNWAGRPAVSRRNNMDSFQDNMNSQWRAEQQ